MERKFQEKPFEGKGKVFITPTMRSWRKKQVTRAEWEDNTRERMQKNGDSEEKNQSIIDSVPDSPDGYYDAWGYKYDQGENIPFEVETNPDLGVDVDLNEAMFTQVLDIDFPDLEDSDEENNEEAWENFKIKKNEL